MAAKKKSSEDSTSSIADGVNAVAHEAIHIIWENVSYNLPRGTSAVIPASLYSHLATRGKVTAAKPNEYEVVVVQQQEAPKEEEAPLVEEPEVTPEEGN
jgi:hypothetical protein